MSQALGIGLCSDNIVTILQPSSTIESMLDTTNTGTFGPISISVDTNTQMNSVSLSPGNYILSINISANKSISLVDASIFIRIGSTHQIPLYTPTMVVTSGTTFASVTCNYVQTTDPIFLTLSYTGLNTIASSTLSCSIYYMKV